MVCIYCGSSTSVTNSRLQQRNNHVWRRRKCLACSAIFTTEEQAQLGLTFVVKKVDGSLEPFARDRLFIAIYESCRHRPTPVEDAAYITQTVISQILERHKDGELGYHDIISATTNTLKRFDSTAATIYAAYHPV